MNHKVDGVAHFDFSFVWKQIQVIDYCGLIDSISRSFQALKLVWLLHYKIDRWVMDFFLPVFCYTVLIGYIYWVNK
jgi:hypothetical protein